MDPLDILPAEVWGLIFEKVEDPQDWLNLYRASSKFEGTVVGKERVRALLPQVFPHVVKYLDHDLNGMMDLRLVSKQWKEVVDKGLESPTDRLDRDFTRFEKKYSFGSSGKISTFLETFSTHPGNPFIGSFVQIWLHPTTSTDDEEELEEARKYKNLVIPLMDKFGSHIKRLCIAASNHEESTDAIDDLLNMLITCARRTPSLEKLNVRFSNASYVDYLEENWTNVAVGEQQSLPIISKLKAFSFSIGGGRLVTLQNMMVRMCCEPGTLKAVSTIGFPDELTGFPNLEEVNLSFDAVDFEEDRTQLAMASWPLTRLTLCHYQENISLGDVKECVERFKETLTSLQIRGSWMTPFEQGSQLRLDLPRLKSLEVPFHQRNFDLLARNLTHLQVFRVWGLVLNEQEIKQLSDVLEKEMLEFNVWEALPKLTKIELTGYNMLQPFCKVFSREKYVQ